MRRRLTNRPLVLGIAAVMAGSIVLPVAASAASPPAFSLTLFPVKAIVVLGQREASFTLLNSGTDAQHVMVSVQGAWLRPAEKSFDLQPGERHVTRAAVVIPPKHDDGDH